MSIFTEDGTLKDTWTTKLQARLEEEQKQATGPFKISDVQVINAEVSAVGLGRNQGIDLCSASHTSSYTFCLPSV